LTIGKTIRENCWRLHCESGVRGLEAKNCSSNCNAAKSVAMEEEYNKKVTEEDVLKVLGVPRLERDKYEWMCCGVVTGLAWTSVGGDILYWIVAFARKGGNDNHRKLRYGDERISDNCFRIY
jgi:ATP-dependent Lon protease